MHPQDVAVKREGWYRLRYRIFDVCSRIRGNDTIEGLAQCDGGPFEVFSTKSFPGLQASTDLTQVRAPSS